MKTEIEILREYALYLQKVKREDSYMYDESFLILPEDKDTFSLVESVVKTKKSSKLKYFIDVGIGGSNLGTRAVYDAIFGHFDLLEPNRFPKMFFVETSDSHYLYGLRSFLSKIKDPEEVLINIVSKSGSTIETLINMEIILKGLKNFEHRTVITTEYGSELWDQATEQDIVSLPIPEKVGGRFSVFSSVGMFPLMCAGLDVKELLKGAISANSKNLTSVIENNDAALSALILYAHYKKNKNIHDTFIFHPEFESLGKWYRQLLAESIGKDAIGITPTVSIGTTDLHSMLQLYLGGPRDKVFTFVSAQEPEIELKVPTIGSFSDITEPYLGKSTNQITNVVMAQIQSEFREAQIPFMSIQLDDLTEFSLGEFIQFKALEIIFLAKLLNIDAFGQPNVENYKVRAKKVISKIKV